MQSKYVLSVFFGVFIFTITNIFPATARAATIVDNDGNFSVWREASDKLKILIADLDQDIVQDLPIPLIFEISQNNLRDNFGEVRSNGRVHEGLDIFVPSRTPIVSPTEAVVIRVGSGGSAGKYVYTANPGNETFAYMHLDEIADIKVGDVLSKGDLIGLVGNTGNASSGSPHLHFEVRNENGPTDPYLRLTKNFDEDERVEYLAEILEKSPKALTLSGSASLNLDLKIGARGEDVKELQRFLAKQKISLSNTVIPDGIFGQKTQKALAQYQASVGIKPSSGYFGSITRAYLETTDNSVWW